MTRAGTIAVVTVALLATPVTAQEFDLGETELVVGGMVAGAVQCKEERCLGAFPVQPEIGVRYRGGHEAYLQLGFAAGDGQNVDTPFNIPPWAAILQTDTRDINGRRNYVLNAWYRYTAELDGGGTIRTTVGVIDAVDYLDENAYSNDEFAQFMNSALVNAPGVFAPSFDTGASFEWDGKHWSATAVYMNVGQNDDGNAYHYVGAQVGYRADTPHGVGNYRVVLDGTDAQFLDPTATTLERRNSLLLSCDQQLGRHLGAFIRFGWQTKDAAVDYGYIYSGGIDIRGAAWGREADGIGIGYGHLAGGNTTLVRSDVAETYYRFQITPEFSLTADVQYMVDRRTDGLDPSGLIFGMRMAAQF